MPLLNLGVEDGLNASRPMRTVAAQNSDAIAVDDGTNVNIVAIPTQQEQAIVQGTLKPAAAAFTSIKQEFTCS